MNDIYWLLIGWLIVAIGMTVVWIVQRRTGDPGLVDVAWGIGVATLGSLFALGAGDGLWERRLLGTVLISLWAVRLSGHILMRLLTMPPDGRYETLRRQWGKTAQMRLFRFFQIQALACVLFATPLLIAGKHTAPLGLLDLVAVVVWLIAVVGESVADRQLHTFRKQPTNRGRVCDVGLWRYSRHPNYFFEWLHWWAYVLLAIAAPWGWLTLAVPAAMYYFLRYVTGIPPAEAQALLSRGEAYRRYQQTTSPFFPWPPNNAADKR